MEIIILKYIIHENYLFRTRTKNLDQKISLTFFEEPLQEPIPQEALESETIGIFVYSKITKEILNKFHNLTYITTMSTGYDHIDLEECKKRKIIVSNVPLYGEIAVAEHTFALILACSRRLIESYQRVKDGWFSPEGLTGFDLSGKTLGVVGVGSIGRHVIKIAHGFGMNVIAYNRSNDKKLEKELNFKFVSFDTLLHKSDVISLHVPYSKKTHHIIGEKEFSKMKEGVVIINTARGGVIYTKALIKALDVKKVGAAGLDVCEGEPLLREEKQLISRQFNKEELLSVLENHMLLSYPNVVITPHVAFNTHEALMKIMKTTIKNIEMFVKLVKNFFGNF